MTQPERLPEYLRQYAGFIDRHDIDQLHTELRELIVYYCARLGSVDISVFDDSKFKTLNRFLKIVDLANMAKKQGLIEKRDTLPVAAV